MCILYTYIYLKYKLLKKSQNKNSFYLYLAFLLSPLHIIFVSNRLPSRAYMHVNRFTLEEDY